MKPVRTISTTSTRITNKSQSTNVTSSSTRRKNRSVFELYYAELCQVQNINQLTVVKQHLDKEVLDFVADRVKFEEWWPIINALSHDRTLHLIGIRSRHPTKYALENIDTELKVRNNCKHPVIKTRYVLIWLMESLKMCVSHSKSLTVLELEGLPLNDEYLALLCQGISQSKSIQHLSFCKSYIQDNGTQVVCSSIRNVPSILSIDLSYCGLTCIGSDIIAGLIKYQKLNRYSETWKQTLRYRDPDVEAMPGLRRITLNGNTEIGDDGLYSLVEELKDDLWIRAIDLQDCGVSDDGGKVLIELIQCNTNLVVVDARGNPFLSQTVLKDIMNNLAINNNDKEQSEYKWISKNSTSNKKSYMISSRPWTCQSTTQLSNVTPSEYSAVTNIQTMKRSKSTLYGKDDYGMRPRTEKRNGITEMLVKQKLQDYENLQSQMQELNVMLKNEVEERLRLSEENNDLKQKLEKCLKEKKKLEETNNDKLMVQNETLVLLENIVKRFSTYLNEDDEEESESSDTKHGEEIPEIITSLKHLLEKTSPVEKQDKCENVKKYQNVKQEDRKQRKKKTKTSQNEIIWEEEEQVIKNNQPENRIKKMFANILEGKLRSKDIKLTKTSRTHDSSDSDESDLDIQEDLTTSDETDSST